MLKRNTKGNDILRQNSNYTNGVSKTGIFCHSTLLKKVECIFAESKTNLILS